MSEKPGESKKQGDRQSGGARQSVSLSPVSLNLNPSGCLRLAILGDVHYSSAGPRDSSMVLQHSAQILKTALDQLARRSPRPDLVVQLGDLGDGAGQTRREALDDLDRAVALFDRSGLPWTWVPGNHDFAVCHGRSLLDRLRRPRPYGEIVAGDTVLLLLNTACDQMFGRLDAAQQEWLEQALELHHQRRIFVFLHHVFDWSHDYDLYLEDGARIRALLLACRAVKAVFMGHAHTLRITTTDGLHEIVSGALTSWPLQFREVEITPDRLRVRFEKVAVPPEIHAAALAAHRAHPKPWKDDPSDGDLAADLPLR